MTCLDKPAMGHHHSSRMPAHTKLDRLRSGRPNQPRKPSGAHAATYRTRQISLQQAHSRRQITGHACRNIHNPANRAPSAPTTRLATPRPISLTAHAGTYIIDLIRKPPITRPQANNLSDCPTPPSTQPANTAGQPTRHTQTSYPTVIVTLLLTILGWSFIDSCAV